MTEVADLTNDVDDGNEGNSEEDSEENEFSKDDQLPVEKYEGMPQYTFVSISNYCESGNEQIRSISLEIFDTPPELIG